jgi:hypothetical protein
MGCLAFLFGLRGTLVARGFCGRSLRFVSSRVRLPNFFGLRLRVDVACWRFGLLEI